MKGGKCRVTARVKNDELTKIVVHTLRVSLMHMINVINYEVWGKSEI